ncbi:MAG TPA: hypothetical protein VGF77_03295 [Allosphingosinicella sp.]
MPATILLFPLSNVLGHLTRAFALAEAFDANGDEVHIVLSRAYPALRALLPPGIRIHMSPELALPRSGVSLASYADGAAADRANRSRGGPTPAGKSRGERMKRMIARDAAIVARVRPDIVVADQRCTPALLPGVAPERLFHVSNMLGYPSFVRRVSGSLPFPLASGRILVPGISEIEHGGGPGAGPAESLCGMFRWRGWRRLAGDAPPPPRSDLFLFFGSTGNSGRLVPWLLRHLPPHVSVSAIAGAAQSDGVRRAHIAPRGDLESFLPRARAAFCHGGHGSVMACIRHQTPMAILPQNIEQLEIGRQVERLGLGILVRRPVHELGPAELGGIVERLTTDAGIRANLRHYSALLGEGDGAGRAVAIVHRGLAGG